MSDMVHIGWEIVEGVLTAKVIETGQEIGNVTEVALVAPVDNAQRLHVDLVSMPATLVPEPGESERCESGPCEDCGGQGFVGQSFPGVFLCASCWSLRKKKAREAERRCDCGKAADDGYRVLAAELLQEATRENGQAETWAFLGRRAQELKDERLVTLAARIIEEDKWFIPGGAQDPSRPENREDQKCCDCGKDLSGVERMYMPTQVYCRECGDKRVAAPAPEKAEARPAGPGPSRGEAEAALAKAACREWLTLSDEGAWALGARHAARSILANIEGVPPDPASEGTAPAGGGL